MKQLIFYLICVVAFSNVSAQSQESLISRFVPNTVDIRSIGMGKTEVAANSGSNALFTNPSLMALQQKRSIKMGSSLNFGFAKDEFLDEFSDANDIIIKYGYKPNIKFTNFSLSLPFHIQLPSFPFSFAVGAGYQNAIDLSFTQYVNTKQQTTTETIFTDNTTRYTGGLNTITPGFSFAILDQISVGISLNIGLGNMKFKTTEVYDIPITNGETDSVVSATGKALYTTIGICGKPMQNLIIGLSFSNSYEWEWDNFESKVKTDAEDRKYDYYGAEFTIPSKFSVGLEYQINPKFTIAAEYQNRPFSSFESDNFYSQGFDYYIDSMDLQDGHVLHIGAELIAGKAPLRLGFFMEPYAITDKKLTNNGNVKYDDSPNYMLGGTLGLGIPIREIAFIDVAAQYGCLKTTNENFNAKGKITRYDKTQHLLRVDLGINIILPSINVNKAASVAQ